jgi:hypothetical protein
MCLKIKISAWKSRMGGSQLRCVILDEYWNEVLALIANCHPLSTAEVFLKSLSVKNEL